MSRFIATDAKRIKQKARIGITGATNTGKTYTALLIAKGLLEAEGHVIDGNHDWSKVVLIDTERNRALFYSDKPFGAFKHINFTPPYHPLDFIEATTYAMENFKPCVIIYDSISHAWNGIGGILEIVSARTESSRTKNQYNEGWGGKGGGTELQNKMINHIMSIEAHTIATFRQKMEYSQDKDENGRTRIIKQGVKPVQRDDLEYEFDVTIKLDNDHSAEIIKSVVPFIGEKGESLPPITHEFGLELGRYLAEGVSADDIIESQRLSLISSIKEMGTDRPALRLLFESIYPNASLTDLTFDQAKTVMRHFRNATN